MTAHYPHLAARIFNTPLMVHPGKLDAIIAGLGPRLLGTDALQGLGPVPELFSTRKGARSDRGYKVVDGVAVLNVGGALVHRSRLDADSTYLLGYNDIAADVEDAMGNADVGALALVFDSPGGEVAGAFELAQRLYAMRGTKPMTAVVDSLAASAAYLAASAADEIVITGTGYAGSIGVVARHVDLSRALDAEGVTVTHIFAGDHKVDGNPYEPLPDAVRADIQADVNDLYQQFIGAVATYRGLPAEALRKTQAQIYRGVAAVATGLADRIGTADQVIGELAAGAQRTRSSGHSAQSPADQGAIMFGTQPGGNQPATTDPAAPAAAAANAAAQIEAASTAGHAAGVQAERERTAGILACEGAAQNAALAHQCITSGLSVEQSTAILAAAPAPAPVPAAVPAAAAANGFTAVMGALGNPKVSGIEAASDAEADAATTAAQILQSFGLPARA